MSAEKDLFDACGEWHRLAEAEGESIRARNWSLVAACQAALAQLQPRLSQFIEAAHREWSQNDTDRTAKEQLFHSVIEDLIRLQRCNATLLEAIRATTREKLNQLGRAGRNLKQLRHSYAGPAPSAWNSFS